MRRVVPNRVWQKRALAVRGKSRFDPLVAQVETFCLVLAQGKDPVPIVVRGKPHRPVTFAALDLGHFANGKIAITVRADEKELRGPIFGWATWATSASWPGRRRTRGLSSSR